MRVAGNRATSTLDGVSELQPVGCYRHPDRATQITCRRCGQPICGECMIPAAVGFQCPQCVRQHAKTSRQNRGVYGGERSANPRLTTITIIVINAVVWGVIQLAGLAKVQYRVVQFLGLLPRGVCMASDQAYYPGLDHAGCQGIGGVWVPGVADGAWWQIFTSIFTHVAILHIAMNCLTLWFLGPALESMLGRVRFLVTYVVAGLVGSLTVYWLSAVTSLSYGGSGSLFGLMGALLFILWRQKADVRQLLMWLGLNVVITVIGYGTISWQAHLGGLVGGVVLAGIWVLVPHDSRRERTQWLAVGGLVVLIAVGLVARTLMLA